MNCRALLLLAGFAGAAALGAAPAEWTDADGARFTGEPLEVFGSLALFRTEEPLVRRVPLRSLSPEDCSRLYRALAGQPARAPRWADASGRATRDLLGRSRQLDPQYRRLVPADLAARPEPQVLVVLYGSYGEAATWSMVNNFMPAYNRIQAVYPGLLGTVFYGLWHTDPEHARITTETWAPWLVTDLARQKEMTTLSRLAPKEGTLMLALTRDGEVLLSARPNSLAATREFVDHLAALLWAAHPANSRAWPDLVKYGRATRPLEFATAAAPPLLVGNPLKADGLRQRGVTRIAARLEVDADGKVTSATLQPGSAVPEAMAAPLTSALRRSAVFLPAMDHGAPVVGTYDYEFTVPPADPQADANAAWLDGNILGEVPLNDWKVLKTIPVNQRDFDEVQGVGPDGKVTMRALEVSKARVSRASQMSAFTSDWFTDAGAASVQPAEGQAQVVDGLTLTWRSLESNHGYVDLQAGEPTPRNYCVGYAWTEIEVSADTSAWLGIGSDDGLKIWHNGALVTDRWTPRYSQLDADIIPLQLKRGKNQLLIKIQNVTGGWSFIARLRYRDR